YRACQAAGIDPTFTPYLDDDPVGFVISAIVAATKSGEVTISAAAEVARLCVHGATCAVSHRYWHQRPSGPSPRRMGRARRRLGARPGAARLRLSAPSRLPSWRR